MALQGEEESQAKVCEGITPQGSIVCIATIAIASNDSIGFNEIQLDSIGFNMPFNIMNYVVFNGIQLYSMILPKLCCMYMYSLWDCRAT